MSLIVSSELISKLVLQIRPGKQVIRLDAVYHVIDIFTVHTFLIRALQISTGYSRHRSRQSIKIYSNKQLLAQHCKLPLYVKLLQKILNKVYRPLKTIIISRHGIPHNYSALKWKEDRR
jgi:hypothetical protein